MKSLISAWTPSVLFRSSLEWMWPARKLCWLMWSTTTHGGSGQLEIAANRKTNRSVFTFTVQDWHCLKRVSFSEVFVAVCGVSQTNPLTDSCLIHPVLKTSQEKMHVITQCQYFSSRFCYSCVDTACMLYPLIQKRLEKIFLCPSNYDMLLLGAGWLIFVGFLFLLTSFAGLSWLKRSHTWGHADGQEELWMGGWKSTGTHTHTFAAITR